MTRAYVSGRSAPIFSATLQPVPSRDKSRGALTPPILMDVLTTKLTTKLADFGERFRTAVESVIQKLDVTGRVRTCTDSSTATTEHLLFLIGARLVAEHVMAILVRGREALSRHRMPGVQ